MTEIGALPLVLAKPQGDVPAERVCLRCKRPFWSEGFYERTCAHCKSSTAWRTAASSPYGYGRSRSLGRIS